MTDLLKQLEHDLEIAEKATPGPWRRGLNVKGCAYVGTECDEVWDAKLGYNFEVRDQDGQRDADFIAHSRTRLPQLAKALKEAQKTLLLLRHVEVTFGYEGKLCWPPDSASTVGTSIVCVDETIKKIEHILNGNGEE